MSFIKKFGGVAFLIFFIPVLLLSGCNVQDESFVKAQKIIEYNEHKYDDLEVSGELVDGVREIHVKAYQFFFTPDKIVVNKGERVRLIISAEDIPHGFEIEGFAIEDYDIDTIIRPGFPLTLEFTADKTGVWEFICSIYCGFGHSTMKGLFIVR